MTTKSRPTETIVPKSQLFQADNILMKEGSYTTLTSNNRAFSATIVSLDQTRPLSHTTLIADKLAQPNILSQSTLDGSKFAQNLG